MADYTNYTAGARGINVKGAGDNITTRWLEPSETLVLADGETISGDVPDLGKPRDADEKLATSLAEANAEIVTLRARIADLEGAASKPKPVGLTGKSKDALAQIAADEGVTIPDGATVNDMIAAIEAKREASAS